MAFIGTLRPFQEQAVDAIFDRQRLLVAYEMGLGKAQPLDEPVLTQAGWKPIGDVSIGSWVVARTGRMTRVRGVYPQGILETYRVSFTDGASTRVSGEHLWRVATNNDLTAGTSRVMTTDEMRLSGLRDGAGNRKYRVPLVQPVVGACGRLTLPLDPYLLGVLLGDGGIKYTVLFSTADAEIVGRIAELLPAECYVKHLQNYDYAIRGTRHKQNPVMEVLRRLGLFGHGAESKWVPEVYFRGSPQQRLALLQGLLDTDGHVRPGDANIEYCTVSLRLAKDVQALIWSLGGTAKIRTKETTGRLAYRMSVRMPGDSPPPFRLTRKAALYRPLTKYKPTRLVDSIEPSGLSECVCIEVEDAEHLYVTRDYIVTHNTVVSICAVEEAVETRRAKQAAVIVPASLKYQWAEKIEEFTGDDNYVIIDGTPAQRAQQYAEAERRKPRYLILNYEKVRDEWPQVSRLVTDDVIRIADEATVFKSFKAKIAKRMKRLGVDIALTGTPIENKPEDLFSIMQAVDPDILGRWDIFDRTFIVRDYYGRIKRVKNLPLLWEMMADAMSRKTRHDPDVAPFMPQVEENVIPVELDRAAAKVYKMIVGELADDLENALAMGAGFDLFANYHGDADDAASLRGQIMSKLTVLRMLCDHPDLVRLSAQLFSDTDERQGSEYAYSLCKERGLLDAVKATPKQRAFMEGSLLNLDDSRAKIVTFSFFKPTLRFLRDEFASYGIGSVIFDGDMTAKQKDAAKREFMTDPDCRVFLSSDAGGYGVDLPNANYLKNYDLPWSAGKLAQRNSRIIRLSSEFDKVHVENYVIRGSIEDRQYRLLQGKLAVASAMVDRQGADDKGRLTLGLESLREFLDATSI